MDVTGKIKIYTYKDLVNFSEEQVILYGMSTDKEQRAKWFGLLGNSSSEDANILFCQQVFSEVAQTCNELFTYVDDVNDCDIIVMPYKWKGKNDKVFNSLWELAVKNKVKLYTFFNDDYQESIVCYGNSNLRFDFYDIGPELKWMFSKVEIFRTSFFKSKKFNFEHAMPPFSPD